MMGNSRGLDSGCPKKVLFIILDQVHGIVFSVRPGAPVCFLADCSGDFGAPPGCKMPLCAF